MIQPVVLRALGWGFSTSAVERTHLAGSLRFCDCKADIMNGTRGAQVSKMAAQEAQDQQRPGE